jgi:hypothetical protein
VHQAIEARFFEAEVGEEDLLFVVVKIGDFGFDGGADGDDFGFFAAWRGRARRPGSGLFSKPSSATLARRAPAWR